MAKKPATAPGPMFPAAKAADEQRKPQPADVVEQTNVSIGLRRDAKCGEVDLKTGDKLADVSLAKGVSLNYLVDAVRNGLAGEVDLPK